MMNKEFKANDLVFEMTDERVYLHQLECRNHLSRPLCTRLGNYYRGGAKNSPINMPSIFHATPENRAALVTLYGEENVPQLPLRGSELTKKLLEKQKYVLCWVSDASEEEARLKKSIELVNFFDDSKDYCCFFTEHGIWWQYAVPIDNKGNEIMELDDE